MNRITIEVYVPAVQRSFDIHVPESMRLAEVTELVVNAMEQLLDGLFTNSVTEALCDRVTGLQYDINLTVWEAGLKNGSCLMMI